MTSSTTSRTESSDSSPGPFRITAERALVHSGAGAPGGIRHQRGLPGIRRSSRWPGLRAALPTMPHTRRRAEGRAGRRTGSTARNGSPRPRGPRRMRARPAVATARPKGVLRFSQFPALRTVSMARDAGRRPGEVTGPSCRLLGSAFAVCTRLGRVLNMMLALGLLECQRVGR